MMAHITRIGPQGRLVIPAALRRAIGLQLGDVVVLRVEDGRLIAEKRENILLRLRARFAAVPNDVSLVDTLIAERRREAARE